MARSDRSRRNSVATRIQEELPAPAPLKYELDQETLTKILDALVKRAIQGDVEAAKYILQRAGF